MFYKKKAGDLTPKKAWETPKLFSLSLDKTELGGTQYTEGANTTNHS
jgi:hypothetical protein